MLDINQTYKLKIFELNILGIKIINNILRFRYITFYTFFKIILFTFFTIIF